VVELNALPEHERPRQAVARGLPELGERGCDGERLIELDQAIEDLLRHGAAVDVADTRRIEGRRLVPERPPIDAAGRAVVGGADTDRQHADDERDDEKEGEHPDPLPPDGVSYEPPPSAVPMAWKNWVVPKDSITGAASRNDARTTSAATSLPIALLLERARLDDGPARGRTQSNALASFAAGDQCGDAPNFQTIRGGVARPHARTP